jgi:hypothetical protein
VFRIQESQLDLVRDSLDCTLCLNLLCEPTALACGHVMCRPCLARILDHAFDTAPSCPLCRTTLAPYLESLNRRARLNSMATGNKYVVVHLVAFYVVPRCVVRGRACCAALCRCLSCLCFDMSVNIEMGLFVGTRGVNAYCTPNVFELLVSP